jgi:hypothetical protein
MKPHELLAELRTLRLTGRMSLWIVHRYLDSRKAVYKILRVDLESNLQSKLRELVRGTIQSIDSAVRFDYDSAPWPGRAFVLDATEGGFDLLRGQIEAGTQSPVAESEQDLVNSFAYIAKISMGGGESLYAFRKVSDVWTIKKVGGFKAMNTYFKGGVLLDLDNRPVFRIDLKLDFLCWKENLFVLDRDAFEVGLNFREGLERQRDRLVEEFEGQGLFDNASVFVNAIGDRLPLLRRVASIRQHGYYKDADYVKSMIERAGEHRWGLNVKDGKIVVQPEEVPTLLKLFNNDRLQSPINFEFFDVWGKEPVSPAAPAATVQPAPALRLAPAPDEPPPASRPRKSARKAPPPHAPRRKRRTAS